MTNDVGINIKCWGHYMGGLQTSVEQDSGDNIWCSSSNESGDFERDPKDKLITETKTEMGKVGWLN